MSKYGVFSLRSKSPYSVRMGENTDQKNLRFWKLFTQCISIQKVCNSFLVKWILLTWSYNLTILWKLKSNIRFYSYTLFYKQRFLPTQLQCVLTFPWIQLQFLLMCCLFRITITLLRLILYLVYLWPRLDLVLFMSHLWSIFYLQPHFHNN